MATIDKNSPPDSTEVEAFLNEITFHLPAGFIDFFKESNGADISSEMNFASLWPLTDMLELNRDYNVDEYAPEFFIFGSNGGEMAFCIEKATGFIFEMPFIGMSKEESAFKSENFQDFLNSL